MASHLKKKSTESFVESTTASNQKPEIGKLNKGYEYFNRNETIEDNRTTAESFHHKVSAMSDITPPPSNYDLNVNENELIRPRSMSAGRRDFFDYTLAGINRRRLSTLKDEEDTLGTTVTDEELSHSDQEQSHTTSGEVSEKCNELAIHNGNGEKTQKSPSKPERKEGVSGVMSAFHIKFDPNNNNIHPSSKSASPITPPLPGGGGEGQPTSGFGSDVHDDNGSMNDGTSFRNRFLSLDNTSCTTSYRQRKRNEAAQAQVDEGGVVPSTPATHKYSITSASSSSPYYNRHYYHQFPATHQNHERNHSGGSTPHRRRLGSIGILHGRHRKFSNHNSPPLPSISGPSSRFQQSSTMEDRKMCSQDDERKIGSSVGGHKLKKETNRANDNVGYLPSSDNSLASSVVGRNNIMVTTSNNATSAPYGLSHNIQYPLTIEEIGSKQMIKSTESFAQSDISDDSDDEERDEWSNPIEFLMSCIAMSVGLGNVWRFPMTAYENGGGAFLIPYLIVLVLIGRPLYFMELAMGQFSSRNILNVWDICPSLRGVAIGQIIATLLVVSYYTSLIAVAIFYLFASFSAQVPWSECPEHLITIPRTVVEMEPATSVCIPLGQNAVDVIQNLTAMGVVQPNVTYKTIGSAEHYFKNQVMHLVDDISEGLGYPDIYLCLCLLLAYIIIFFIMWRGVASSGKVSYFLALFPYLVLIVLLIRGVTLPGAATGIYYFIKPNWSYLLKIEVWYKAVSQSFFSLAVGFGSLVTFGSYNNFRHTIYRDVMIISVVDTCTSLLAGVTIFAVLGNLAFELDKPVDHVIDSGTGLAFITYPMAISKFGVLPQLFAVPFFLMLITLGLGSTTGWLSGVISGLTEIRGHRINRYLATFVICLILFAVGTVYFTPGGQHILQLVDYFGGGFVIFVMALLEIVGVHYVYGMNKFIRDIRFMMKRDLGWYWKSCWFVFIPVLLVVILVLSLYRYDGIMLNGRYLPTEATTAGWIICLVSLAQIPYWYIHTAFLEKGDTCAMKFKNTWKALPDWGPRSSANFLEWKKYIQEIDYQKAEEQMKKDDQVY